MANNNLNIKVLIDAADSAKTIQQTRQALRDLRSAALQVEEGSEAFNQINQAAGQLQDRIGDLRNQTNFFADDMRSLSGLSAIGTGIAGGFNVLQGSMALISGESEVLDEAMKKVQITMGIINGIKEVSILLNKNETAAIFANNVATKAAAAAQLVYATAVGTSTGALRLFRIALLATGIGAVVVAVGLLIENWDKLTKAIGLSTESLKDYNEQLNAQKKAESEIANDRISNTEKILSAEAKTSQQIGSLEEERLQNQLIALENRKKSGEINELEYRKQKARIEDEIRLEKEYFQELENIEDQRGQITLERLKRTKSLTDMNDELIKITLEQQEALNDGDEKRQKILKIEYDAIQERAKDAEKTNERLTKKEEIQIKALEASKEEIKKRDILRTAQYKKDLQKIEKEYNDEVRKKELETANRGIENIEKSRESQKKAFDESIKEIDAYVEKLKLSDMTASDLLGIPQEVLDANLLKLRENARKDLERQSLFNKQILENNLGLINAEEQERIRIRKERIANEIRYLGIEIEAKKESARNTISDSKLLNDEIGKLEEDKAKRTQRINQEGQNEINAIISEGERKRIEAIRDYALLEKQVRQQALDVMVQASNEAYDAIAAKVQQTYEQMIKMSNAEYAARQKNIDREIEDFRNQGKEISAEEQLRLDKEREFQAKKDQLEAERADKEKKLKAKAFETQRSMDLLAISMNTAVAIMKQLTLTPLPLGAPLIAAIAAQGVVQSAIIATAQPTFAEGGLVVGPGGPKDDKINARLSNGESVINAKSTRMYAPLLSQINQAGGGKPIPAFADGGMAQTQSPVSGVDLTRIEQIMLEVASRPIETYVKESSVTGAQKKAASERKRTTF